MWRHLTATCATLSQHLWLFTALCLCATLGGVLWACIRNDHLPPEFPSPSDTGVFQPEGAYFTFGLFWSMVALAATMYRHCLVFGTFLCQQSGGISSSSATAAAAGGGCGSGVCRWVAAACMPLLREQNEARLLRIGTAVGMVGACFGTMVAAFDVRRHVVLHTIGAAFLFIFVNIYYSILLRINQLILKRLSAREHWNEDPFQASGDHKDVADSPTIASSSSALVLVDTLAEIKPPRSARLTKESKSGVANESSTQNLTWLRLTSLALCWLSLLGIMLFRLQFVYEGGHKSEDKQRAAFLIFWANLFEWIWIGVILMYGFIVFYWDYYHSPVMSPHFSNPLVFNIQCEVHRSHAHCIALGV